MRKSGATIIICFVIAGYAYAAVSPTKIFDSFGDICCDDEKARLDNFAVALTIVRTDFDKKSQFPLRCV